MTIRLPFILWSRLRSVAAALGVSPCRLIVLALVRYLGMEGMPLPDETVWAKEDER